LTWAKVKELPVPEELTELLRSRTEARTPEPGGKRIKSLYRILSGIAVQRYNYDASKRNDASATIATELERVGINMDQDTIRSCLKDAWDALSPEERPKK
jgi:hypothetical protein